jgi:1,4-alpha-glucan branching enzyme
VPNRYGGNENLDAIGFLRRLNETVYSAGPGAFTVAEESTAWEGSSATLALYQGVQIGTKFHLRGLFLRHHSTDCKR